MLKAEIVVSEVMYGNQSIQTLEERLIEQLLFSRYAFDTQIFKPVSRTHALQVCEDKR